ncbi:MAG: hypothetical protein AAGC55_09185, partial [Myxococcota bacterium]
VDFPADPGCGSAGDDNEDNGGGPILPQCSNGLDDDSDGDVDLADAGCSSVADPREALPADAPAPLCKNGMDDDADGIVDFPLDPGCSAAGDEDEADPAVPPGCGNGADDDGDGIADFPDDPGCESPDDIDESDDCPLGPGCPQCANQIDDDGDGLIDFGNDPGCEAAGDNEEQDECLPGITPQLLTDAGVTGTTPALGVGSNFQGSCNGSTNATEDLYSYILATAGLSSLSFSTVGSTGDTVLYARSPDCDSAAAELDCRNDIGGGETITIPDPAVGEYFVFVDGNFVSGIDYTLSVSGTIPLGLACDPLDTQFVCDAGLSCDSGTMTCVAAACDNGVDDDADGASDFPADPGCTSPSDDDESDDCPAGMDCPQCGNGIDDDSDGAIDYPADFGCEAASDDEETTCAEDSDTVLAITDPASMGTTVGLTNDFAPSCALSSAPDQVYALRFPGDLNNLIIDTIGSSYDTVIMLKTPTCAASDLDCDNDGVSPQSIIALGNVAAGVYFIVVDGDGSAEGAYTLNVSGEIKTGQACDPAQVSAGIFTCEGATACTDMGAGFLCQ